MSIGPEVQRYKLKEIWCSGEYLKTGQERLTIDHKLCDTVCVRVRACSARRLFLLLVVETSFGILVSHNHKCLLHGCTFWSCVLCFVLFVLCFVLFVLCFIVLFVLCFVLFVLCYCTVRTVSCIVCTVFCIVCTVRTVLFFCTVSFMHIYSYLFCLY